MSESAVAIALLPRSQLFCVRGRNCVAFTVGLVYHSRLRRRRITTSAKIFHAIAGSRPSPAFAILCLFSQPEMSCFKVALYYTHNAQLCSINCRRRWRYTRCTNSINHLFTLENIRDFSRLFSSGPSRKIAKDREKSRGK